MFFGISPFASGPFSTTLETRLIAQSIPATSSAGSITVVGHANFSLTGSSNIMMTVLLICLRIIYKDRQR